MAKSKMMLSNEWGNCFQSLPDEQAGKLIKALFSCHEGEEVTVDDPILSAVFAMMSAVVNENAKKYEDKCKQNAENRAKATVKKAERPSTTVNDRPQNKIKEKEIKEIKEKDVLTDIQKESAEPLMVSAKKIVDHLNEKAGTHYRSSSKATVDLIKARLNEKWTVEDFFTVIDNKCAEWLGTEQEQYLRPETLFCLKHFESYLNHKPRSAPKKSAWHDFEQRSGDDHKALIDELVAQQLGA